MFTVTGGKNHRRTTSFDSEPQSTATKGAGLTRWCRQHSPCSADGYGCHKVSSCFFRLEFLVLKWSARPREMALLATCVVVYWDIEDKERRLWNIDKNPTAVAERPCWACMVYFVSFENSVKLFLCCMTPDNDILTTCIIVLVSFGCCDSWCYDPYVISYFSRSALFALFFAILVAERFEIGKITFTVVKVSDISDTAAFLTLTRTVTLDRNKQKSLDCVTQKSTCSCKQYCRKKAWLTLACQTNRERHNWPPNGRVVFQLPAGSHIVSVIVSAYYVATVSIKHLCKRELINV